MHTSGSSILRRLASSDVDVRRLALIEQEELLEVASYRDLLPLLDNENVNAFSKHPSEAGELTLLRSLNDDRWEVAREAILALGKRRTPVSEQLTPFFTHEL